MSYTRKVGTNMALEIAQQPYCFTSPCRGADRAWELLVQRYQPYLLRLAATYRIGEEAHDAVQNTFLRLLEHGESIRRPEVVKYWLASTLRNECLAIIRRRRRSQPVADEQLDALLPASTNGQVDLALVRESDAELVRRALSALPVRQQRLLLSLSEPEGGDYRAIGEELGMPVGSIGPTRQRALARLRATLFALGYERSA